MGHGVVEVVQEAGRDRRGEGVVELGRAIQIAATGLGHPVLFVVREHALGEHRVGRHVVRVGAERVERGERERVGRNRIEPPQRPVISARELRADGLDVLQPARIQFAPHPDGQGHVVAYTETLAVVIGFIEHARGRDPDAVVIAHRGDVRGDRARLLLGAAQIAARGEQQLGDSVGERVRNDAASQVEVAQRRGIAGGVPETHDARVQILEQQLVDLGFALLAELGVRVVEFEAEAETGEVLSRLAAHRQRGRLPRQLGRRRGRCRGGVLGRLARSKHAGRHQAGERDELSGPSLHGASSRTMADVARPRRAVDASRSRIARRPSRYEG